MKNQLRIIGGQFRGRKIQFSDLPGLRPTPDRIRETLFNWLSEFILNANCLDCFAGSGALGIEALSRGAAQVTFIDAAAKAIQQIQQALQQLNIINANLQIAAMPTAITSFKQAFNIIFLDPPFHKNLIANVSQFLEENKYLAENAMIYLETEAELETLPIPINWQILKHKQAGQVAYWLARRTSVVGI